MLLSTNIKQNNIMKNIELIEQIKAMGNEELCMAMRKPTGEFVMYVVVDKRYAMDMLDVLKYDNKQEFFLGKTGNGSIFLDCK